jgi:hypothetical protein
MEMKMAKAEKKEKSYLILGFKERDANIASMEVIDAFSTVHNFVAKHKFLIRRWRSTKKNTLVSAYMKARLLTSGELTDDQANKKTRQDDSCESLSFVGLGKNLEILPINIPVAN